VDDLVGNKKVQENFWKRLAQVPREGIELSHHLLKRKWGSDC
jgi:hypothetical protein